MKPSALLAIPALFALLLWLLLPSAKQERPASATATAEPLAARDDAMQGALLPLPPVAMLPAEKVALGKRLFHDTRLSGDNSISCASCHALMAGGMDRRRVPVGIKGQTGSVNTPTVFNSALNFAQFWDGRASTLEDQALGPIHNPIEMGSNVREVIDKLSLDPHYQQAFRQNYPDGMTAANIAAAIATYERSLITANSRFDRYLRGETDALVREEIEGYRRFVNYGCASCHQGAGIGGNMFQRFGVMADFFKGRQLSKADLGRYNVTGLEEDRHVFKVPSLRNVAVTAPYFHDGSVQRLEKAVEIMGLYQLGKALSAEDVKLIVAFLHSLSGEWEGQVLQ
jgi:cytochrome c peroxidase